MSVTRLKIFGERNTGTNFIEALLKRNVNCEVVAGNLSGFYSWRFVLAKKLLSAERAFNYVEKTRDKIFEKRFAVDGGWKHARTPNFPDSVCAYPPDMGMIAITKNPYAWLLSLHKRPYLGRIHTRQNPLMFSEFIRQPWQTVGRECAQASYDTPIHMWNDKVAAYFNLPELAPTLIQRYEEVIADIPGFLSSVSTTFDTTLAEQLDIPGNSSKKDGRTTQDIVAYYRENQWRSSFSDDDIAFVNQHLDTTTVQRIGYEILH